MKYLPPTPSKPPIKFRMYVSSPFQSSLSPLPFFLCRFSHLGLLNFVKKTRFLLQFKMAIRLNYSPAAESLIPIRLDIEIEGQRLKDAFTWNPSDPDSEVMVFARRTVKDLKLPPAFVTQIVQSIQSQLAEFRSYEGQEMNTGEKIVPIKLDFRVNRTVVRDQFLWDLNNFESDPEEFARTLCRDMDIADPEVGPAIAVAIREQLYEIAIQNVASARETRVGKKGRRATEYVTASKSSGLSMDVVKLFGNKASVIRKRKEWDVYEPIVDVLSAEEAEALDAREERNARMKKKLDDKDDYASRFTRS